VVLRNLAFVVASVLRAQIAGLADTFRLAGVVKLTGEAHTRRLRISDYRVSAGGRCRSGGRCEEPWRVSLFVELAQPSEAQARARHLLMPCLLDNDEVAALQQARGPTESES
jgi:hypothetical protein